MRALLLNSTKNISYETIKKPKIKLNEVRVKVFYSPVNPSDLGFIGNVYGRIKHKKYPLGLGFEGSGEIEDSHDKELIGKKVCFVTNYENENFVGAWSDHTTLNKGEYIVLPNSYTDMKKAACMFINPLTALCFIDIMKKANYSSAIHTAGASAVGRIFTKLCAKNQFKVINTVRKERYLEELKAIGSSFTVCSSKDNYKQELLLAKEEFYPKVAFDSIGGDMTGTILNSLAEEGTLYHYGNLSLRNLSNISTHDILFLDKKILGFWLFKYLNRNNSSSIHSSFIEILKESPNMFETNITSVFKPERFEEAFKIYKNEMSKGKVLFDFNS